MFAIICLNIMLLISCWYLIAENQKNKTQIKSNNYIPEFILSMLYFHKQTSIDALFICKVKIILILLKHQILNILFHIIPVGTTISVCW